MQVKRMPDSTQYAQNGIGNGDNTIERTYDKITNYNLNIFRTHCKVSRTLCTITQIELNTIASSFGGLSTRISKMHAHLIRRFDLDFEGRRQPENDKLIDSLAESLFVAHEDYLSKNGIGKKARVGTTTTTTLV